MTPSDRRTETFLYQCIRMAEFLKISPQEAFKRRCWEISQQFPDLPSVQVHTKEDPQ